MQHAMRLKPLYKGDMVMEIGLQMYTIAPACQDLQSLDESMKRVADIGYKNIQLSGVCEYEPEWIKERLDKYGLKCVLTHRSPDELCEDPAKVAKLHDIFDCDYIGLGMYKFDETPEDYQVFLDKFTPVAKGLKENGKFFLCHNHDYEFAKINGKRIIEKMQEDFSADLLGFTFDVYWAVTAGADPVEWIEKLSGRIPCLHIKDLAVWGRKPRMAPIGEGNMRYDKIFAAAEKAGTKYMLVEQDTCYEEDPFDCIKRSYDYLRSCGF